MQTNSQEKHFTLRYGYKCLTFIIVLYFIGWATSYLLVYRIVDIGHNILLSSAIFLYPLTYALADVITEVYGYAVARQVVWSSLIGGFVFCTTLTLINNITIDSLNKQSSYDLVFHPLLKSYFVLLISSVFSSIVNIYIISKWKIIVRGRIFWLRSLLSTGIGEFVFSAISSPLCFGGVVTMPTIIQLITVGYAFKMIYAILTIIPITYLVNILKTIEKVDAYDYGVDYNPFKLTIGSKNLYRVQQNNDVK